MRATPAPEANAAASAPAPAPAGAAAGVFGAGAGAWRSSSRVKMPSRTLRMLVMCFVPLILCLRGAAADVHGDVRIQGTEGEQPKA